MSVSKSHKRLQSGLVACAVALAGFLWIAVADSAQAGDRHRHEYETLAFGFDGFRFELHQAVSYDGHRLQSKTRRNWKRAYERELNRRRQELERQRRELAHAARALEKLRAQRSRRAYRDAYRDAYANAPREGSRGRPVSSRRNDPDCPRTGRRGRL